MVNVTRDDVEQAISSVLREGFPAARKSTKFCLVANGAHLPPKYVLGVAAKNSVGRELKPDEFYGGAQTNELLRSLGFEVKVCGCGGKVVHSQKSVSAPRAKPDSTAEAEKGPLDRLKHRLSEWIGSDAPASKAPSAARNALSTNTTIVRVVVNGAPPGLDLDSAAQTLLEAFERWPKGVKSKFAITPGGFIVARWPKGANLRLSWDSRTADLPKLTRVAEDAVGAVLSRRVLRRAANHTQFLTVGVDIDHGPNGAHAELVALIDVASGQCVRWTGKSYPVGYQVKTLWQVADLKSHLIEAANERVLILGCHDLVMYDPRGQANATNGTEKYTRSRAMQSLVSHFKPTVVLQHPHSTDSQFIWRNAWANLKRMTPGVRSWGSGIAYYNAKRRPRRPLAKVLDATRSDDVIDIVVKGTRPSR
ncbi:MAG: hypothetical protein R3B89_34835 [Polyangiaceae bacterium]